MSVVVLVEFQWSGHHPGFFKLFTRVLLESGCEVLALCPEPREMQEWVAQNLPARRAQFRAASFFRLDEIKLPDHRLRSAAATALALRRTTALARRPDVNPFGTPDFVLFACLYSAKWIFPALADRLLPYPWACLLLSPAEVLAQWRKERPPRVFQNFDRLTLLRSRNCRAVLSLNECVAGELSAALGGKPVFAVPDVADLTTPSTTFPLAAQLSIRARGRKIVGQFGMIGLNKGHLTLLRAAHRMERERYFFVIAGALSKDPRNRAENLAKIENEPAFGQENVMLHLEHIPDEACYNALVTRCDAVYMAYLDFPDSSNNMVRAACFQKPIIVSEGYLMESRVRRFQIGVAIPQGDAVACASAIEQVTDAAWNAKTAPRFADFAREHRAENLRDTLDRVVHGGTKDGAFPSS